MLKRATVLAVLVACVLAAPAALAQDKYTRDDGIRDKFVLRAGFYFASHDTFTRLQPRDLPDVPGFDLETDTGFADSTTDFRAEAAYKLGRRHKIRLGWVDMKRTTDTTLQGEIDWGDETFPIDANITGNWDTRVIKFDYRYALIKRARVDFGLSLGLFLFRVTSGLDLVGDAAGAAEDVRKSAPLPMLGGDIEWLVSDRWLVRGGAQYLGIAIDDTVDGSWLEARAAVEYNLSKNFGIGAAFLLADIDVAAKLAEAAISEFEYEYKFSGPSIFAFANF